MPTKCQKKVSQKSGPKESVPKKWPKNCLKECLKNVSQYFKDWIQLDEVEYDWNPTLQKHQ